MSLTANVALGAILFLAAPGFASAPVTATPLLKTTTTWNGAPIIYSRTDQPEIQSVLVRIAPGAATPWHQHPINNVAYMLAGTIRLELEDGTTRVFKAGQAFAEVVGTLHRGVNIGPGPVRILVVYVGEAGTPLSVPKPGNPAE